MGTPWIIASQVDERWPYYTRGNVGEVFPEVVTNIGYTLGVIAAERAWRNAYRELGISSTGDFQSDEPVILGLFGGYTYLNLSFLRMMGVRAPGSSAEAIDVSFFGEGNPPPYVPRKGDTSLLSSFKILKTVLGALGQTSLPDEVRDSFDRAAAFEAKRPSLDAPDEALFDYMYSFPRAFEPVFGNHMKTTALAAIVSGILTDAAIAAGDPGLVTHLIGAAGDVHSTKYSEGLYALALEVKGNPTVSAAFDAGTRGLLDRLADDPAAMSFLTSFEAFIAEHGQRGPNDWEISSRTWDNTPELALSAIDALRKAEKDLAPSTRLGDDDAKRQAAITKVRPHLGRLDRLSFDKAVQALPVWAQAREATRDRAVRIILPLKQVFRELVRRAAENGGDSDPVHVGLLDPFTELPAYVREPALMMSVLRERSELHKRFSKVVPPFFITSQDEVPTIEELEENQPQVAERASEGDVLKGDAGCSGAAIGRVRVVLDPADASDLIPGEVLVAPLTDPSWTPLFLPAAAVVVNVGALMSHAVIVARELAIPCVVAVAGATEMLRTGMMVEVDGTAGTVKVIEA